MSDTLSRWWKTAIVCQLTGLAIVLLAILDFNRFTMLVLFGIGLPLTLLPTLAITVWLIRQSPPVG